MSGSLVWDNYYILKEVHIFNLIESFGIDHPVRSIKVPIMVTRHRLQSWLKFVGICEASHFTIPPGGKTGEAITITRILPREGKGNNDVEAFQSFSCSTRVACSGQDSQKQHF